MRTTPGQDLNLTDKVKLLRLYQDPVSLELINTFSERLFTRIAQGFQPPVTLTQDELDQLERIANGE